MYTTPQTVRDLLGLTPSDADDAILYNLINKAQRIFLQYIQIPVNDEVVSLDSTGTTIRLDYPFIADTNFDRKVDEKDIQLFAWGKSGDPSTKVEITAKTVYPEYGIVVVDSPLNQFEAVTASYSYYTCAINWNIVDLAVAYYTGMLWVAREEFLVPEDLTIGGMRIRQRQPWERLREEFLRLVFHMVSIPMDITNYRKMMRSARSPLKYTAPGTVIEREDLANLNSVVNGS